MIYLYNVSVGILCNYTAVSVQVRLYDISAQRRPVISFDFRETAIKSVAEDIDGYTIYVGNGSGDLAAFDMRTGKWIVEFKLDCY